MSRDKFCINAKKRNQNIELEAKTINVDIGTVQALEVSEEEIKQILIELPDKAQSMEVEEFGVAKLCVEPQDVEAIHIKTLGRGLPGVGLDYKWDGTKLGIKRDNQTEYQFIDLQGMPGIIGKSLEFIWEGTKLGIRLQGDSEYTFVDLKGETDCKELTNLEIEEILK